MVMEEQEENVGEEGEEVGNFWRKEREGLAFNIFFLFLFLFLLNCISTCNFVIGAKGAHL